MRVRHREPPNNNFGFWQGCWGRRVLLWRRGSRRCWRVLAEKFARLSPHLDERRRRLVLGTDARALGRHGGIRLVARAAGVSEETVSRGVAFYVAAGPATRHRSRRSSHRAGSARGATATGGENSGDGLPPPSPPVAFPWVREQRGRAHRAPQEGFWVSARGQPHRPPPPRAGSSRRMKPTPRTVCRMRGRPPASSLRRR